MDRPLFNICEWPASLYDDNTRRWMYGTLIIQPEDIGFIAKDNKPENKLLTFPYEDLIDVKKSTTGLVFGAVYLLTKENKKIWFSSLPDRESVYGALKHFWESKLFKKKNENKKKETQGGKTVMGQRLLGIVKDSEATLSKAAVQLYNQGEQIDNALDTMSDLHDDLDIADNMMETINSWFGKWRLPDVYQVIDPVFVNKSDVPELFEYEVLFIKLEPGRANTRQVGTLRISKDGLTVLNMRMRTEYHFNWSDVSQIRVVTPWEIMVTKFHIGKPDLVYSIVSAAMVAILKLLDKCARYKMKYDTPPEKVLCTNHKKAEERQEILGKTGSHDSKSAKSTGIPSFPSHIPTGVDQIQIAQSKQIVSEKEADDISRSLAGLKSLALSVQGEELTQNEKLVSLTASVDRANQRLADKNKKINKML